MSTLADENLAGRVAVVTGSSSGIGRAIARHLALAGAAVIVHGRREETLQAVVAELSSDGKAEVGLIAADLADPHQQDRLVAEAWRWRGGVDIWVNNAGVDLLTGPAPSWSFDRKLEELFLVDVTATIRVSRAVGDRMKRGGHGVILNMGWDRAAVGMGGDSGELFAAAKGAVMAFTRSLARSLAPQVRVNCLAPGWIRTAWAEQASEYWQRRGRDESLLARWGTPDDVARVARFLVSPAAGFLTGQIVDVNGGCK